MKRIGFLAIGIALYLSTSTSAMEVDRYIERRNFFEDATGLDETTFRTKLGWNPQTKSLTAGSDLDNEALQWINTSPSRRGTMPQSLLNWIKGYPRRAAIFSGTVDMYSLGQINDTLLKRNPQPLGAPRFTIQVHNPNKPTLTDVRSLVALPENKDAGFQVASTFFGMLEGGMSNPNKLVTDMLQGAAQGEEISISTAPATIYRKYFYPQGYLLEGLGNKARVFTDNKGRERIDRNAATTYQYAYQDKLNVAIGLHTGAVVSNGAATNPFKKPEPIDQQQQLPIFLFNTGFIDSAKTQTVNLLFTAAYSLRDNEELAKNPSVVSFCRMLLEASYEATLKSLALTGQPKVFLTLMGASAFSNPIEWVGNAISREPIRSTIVDNGLDVRLIYRMDYKPHRNAAADAQFLIKMFALADTINGTTKLKDNKLLEQTINVYTQRLYAGNTEEASGLAELLMKWQQ